MDFSAYAGKQLILYNDAPAPFPDGDDRNDYFAGAPDNPAVSVPGFGPNTREIMLFNSDIEVWQIVNLTGDTHPIHFHLVNSQIISRQRFKLSNYNGTPTYTGTTGPPEPNEAGWKDTVRINPDEVTTVIMQFKLPTVLFAVPSSPRTGGNEYVWHCHNLEHGEHDMMRPLVVL